MCLQAPGIEAGRWGGGAGVCGGKGGRGVRPMSDPLFSLPGPNPGLGSQKTHNQRNQACYIESAHLATSLSCSKTSHGSSIIAG